MSVSGSRDLDAAQHTNRLLAVNTVVAAAGRSERRHHCGDLEAAEPAHEDALLALRVEIGDDDRDGLTNDPTSVDRQAVLGANLMLGLPETQGLPTAPLMP